MLSQTLFFAEYNPATGTGGLQSSGVNIHMHVGSGATVFAPCLSNVQAKDITFSQNNAGKYNYFKFKLKTLHGYFYCFGMYWQSAY